MALPAGRWRDKDTEKIDSESDRRDLRVDVDAICTHTDGESGRDRRTEG